LPWAGVPAEVTFTTKPKLGRAMLERALDAGVPCAWVTGDTVYGADHALRRAIEARRRGYVLAAASGWAPGAWTRGWPGSRRKAGTG
jgi:SRSO17 transposase